MNFKKSALASAITLATFATGAAAFDASSWEVSGFVKNETAALQGSGTFIGQYDSYNSTGSLNDSGDVIKFENTLKLFVNGALGENADLHAELNFVADPEAKQNDYSGHVDYSQNDYLRELYIDSVFGENSDVELRVGKQQVVWGTADGAKLLDIINPTDYRELAQNTMEDSRIPVWMAKLELPTDNSGSLQLIVAQPRENIYAGLDRDVATSVRANNTSTLADLTTDGHAQGSAFIVKGVDTITGRVNGFLNISPDLGSVAGQFAGGFNGLISGLSGFQTLYSGYMHGFTVGGFESMTMGGASPTTSMAGALNYYNTNPIPGYGTPAVTGTDYDDLPAGFVTAIQGVATTLFGSGYSTAQANSITGAQMLALGFQPSYNTNLANQTDANDTAFDYMDKATFRTFDAFVNANSQYTYNMPDDLDLDYVFRYKNNLDNGLNYSVNYAYSYDKNPVINLSWRNSSGEELTVDPSTANGNTTLLLKDSSNNYYGGYTGNYATLRFEQTLERAHNLGAAFDYTIDSESLGGVVLRGEFLYTKDSRQPVIDLGRLSIGDLTNALKMEKADKFKYVLGADVTVMTNMLVSGQFIQERNLDYVDTTSDYYSRQKYTADFATMHLTNGFNKARENKEFYSLFLSKPFGPNQLGRWNNIFMYEEGGGKWNRFDVEYSFSDELVGSFELNNYWGDVNTQFGQLENSSNIQVGLKYLF
jgi:hypothetical protein